MIELVQDARDRLPAAPASRGIVEDQVRLPGHRRGASRPASSSSPRARRAQEAMDIEDGPDRRVPGQAAGDRRGARPSSSACRTSRYKSDRIKPIGPAEEPEARVRRGEPVDADRGHQGGPGRDVPRPGARAQLAHGRQRLPAARRSSTGSPRRREFEQTLDLFFGADGGGGHAASRSATCCRAWTRTRRPAAIGATTTSPPPPTTSW